MRWVICVLALLGFVPSAAADDFDVLRGAQPVGPPVFNRWSGFYVGGQVGYGAAAGDFSNATNAPIAYVLRETYLENDIAPSNWPVLGSDYDKSMSFGGFVGYNTQWQDLILGIEANYSQASMSLNAPSSPISRTSTDSQGTSYAVNMTGNASVSDLDFGSIRGRAGWILGNFLPYAFVGLALGEAKTVVQASINGEQNPPSGGGVCSPASTPACTPFSFSNSVSRNSQVLVGFSVGAGLDVALTQNVFLRGELEFVQFAPVSGIVIDVSTARFGAGVKF